LISRSLKRVITSLICLGTILFLKSAIVPAAELFSDREPYETGYLRVSDLHEIYFELCGNPDGKPVIVLHGGPGVGSYPRLRQYFDPERFKIVLHDQRGAGKSRPIGEIRENTTWDLVADIERLREHLGLNKCLIFGGSWGSTLALAYAQEHPEHVTEMILRGIFLGTQEEIDHHYLGAARFFPQKHEELLAVLPDPERRPLPPYLLELVQSNDDIIRKKCLDALARFEIKMGQLLISDEQIDAILASFPHEVHRALSRVDLHYVSNNYFLEEEQLLRDAYKIEHIPITLVNGRYDVVCPPLAAYRIHKLLPQSRLIIVEEAGHSERETGITSALVEAVAAYE